MIRSRFGMTGRLLVLGALLLGAGIQGRAQQPVFRSGATLVTASVSVKRGNRPVSGLTAADFIVTDNGVPQTVERVAFEEVPIDVTVVIDLSGSTSSIVDEIRRDTRRILGFLRPIDQVRVVTIDTYVHEVIPQQLAVPTLGLPERMVSGGASSIRDAIAAALISRTDPERRRLVVAITDGDDTKSVTEAATVMELARRSDTVLHIVFVRPPGMGGFGGGGLGGPGGFGAPVMPMGTGAGPGGGATGIFAGPAPGSFIRRKTYVTEWDLLLDATVMTGGGFHGARHGAVSASEANAVEVFRRLFDEFRQSYVIQFNPENVSMTGWHDLVVKVKGVDDKGIKARRGYFAGR